MKPQSIPPAEPNGFIKTLNNMGYMTSTLDLFSKEFIQFSAKQNLPALDIGAAYGIASKAALEAGAKIIANDIDPAHLELLEQSLAPNLQKNLIKLSGDCLQLNLEPESLSAILICRVMHFFRGEQIEMAAKLFHRWLIPGGRVFIVGETPYLKNFTSFIPVYENRKKAGIPWPGFVESVKLYAPERAPFLPEQMHLLDSETLTLVFEKIGFKTISCHTIARLDFPEDIQLDGRESVGYIGEK